MLFECFLRLLLVAMLQKAHRYWLSEHHFFQQCMLRLVIAVPAPNFLRHTSRNRCALPNYVDVLSILQKLLSPHLNATLCHALALLFPHRTTHFCFAKCPQRVKTLTQNLLNLAVLPASPRAKHRCKLRLSAFPQQYYPWLASACHRANA